jgi:drug/metabolite transporter (DMT)-like permease
VSLSGERAALGAFVTGSVLAGGNAVGVRFSNRELAPLWGAGLRFLLAAALLVAAMVALGLTVPRGRALAGASLYGALNFGLAFALAYYGFVHIQAGLGQTLLALVPLLTLLLAVFQRQERLRVGAIAGAILAVAGIGVLSRAPLQEAVPFLSLLALLGSAVCFAQAAILVRHFPPVHPVTTNAVGMTSAALLLIPGAVLFGEPIALPRRVETWLALSYLIVVGSVVVFVLYVFVLRHWTASRAAYTFVLVPVVTVVLSAWLDDEPIRAGLLLGGSLVLAGVYVGALRRGGSRPPPGARPAIEGSLPVERR